MQCLKFVLCFSRISKMLQRIVVKLCEMTCLGAKNNQLLVFGRINPNIGVLQSAPSYTVLIPPCTESIL